MSLYNTFKGHAAGMDAQRGVPRHGIVASVDPARAVVRVTLDEDGTLSGWLPVAQLAAGGNWSGVCLPTPGTQVFMAPDMGDQSSLVVLGAVHFNDQPPGKVTPYKASSAVPLVPGEVTFMHPGGASFRLTASGVIEMHGTVKIDGDLLVSGQIRDLDGVHDTLDVLRQDYVQHKHTGVQPGSGTTGLTDHPTP